MKLRIQAGPRTGETIDLPPTRFTIGRDVGCDLRLELAGISRQHARITCQDGLFRIEDLGSTNGVRVNGQQIQGSRSLINGDRIGIGDAILLFTDEHSIIAEDDLSKLEERTIHSAGHAGMPSWLPGVIIAVIVLALVGGAAFWLMAPPATTAPPADNDTTVVTDEPPPTAPGPAAPTPRPALPSAPKPAKVEPLHYYYVQSNPPGASILFDDQPAGTTPAMLMKLTRGTHHLQLTMPGYDPLSLQFLFVPADGKAPVYSLIQSNATCRITSEPAGATVFRGARILGRTPMVATSLPPGKTELRFEAPGRETATAEAEIDPLRPSELHVKLQPNLGAIEVTTYPADSKIIVDGVQVAVTEPASPQEYYSAPLLLDGLAAGGHEIYMDCHGLKTQPTTITVEAGGKLPVMIAHYLPNVTVEMLDGRTVTGMLRRQGANGDLELSLPRRQKINIRAQLIKKVTITPFDEFVSKQLRGEDHP